MTQGYWDKTKLVKADTAADAGWSPISGFDSNISLSLVDDVDADRNPVLMIGANGQDGVNSAATFAATGPSGTIEVLSSAKYAVDVDVEGRGNGVKFAFYLQSPHGSEAIQRSDIYPETDLRATQVQPFISRASAGIGDISQEGRYEWYRVRVEPTGNTNEVRHRAKWWLGASSDEPVGWVLDVTYTIDAGQPTSGLPGFFVRNGTDEHYIDYFSWGTDGDVAPTEPSSGVATPINLSVSNTQQTSARLGWEAS